MYFHLHRVTVEQTNLCLHIIICYVSMQILNLYLKKNPIKNDWVSLEVKNVSFTHGISSYYYLKHINE